MKQAIAAFGLASAALLQALDFAAAEENCTCRALGREFEVGQTACLLTPKGHRIATCGTVLNNTAWLFSDAPCVSSRAPSTSPALAREMSTRVQRVAKNLTL